MKEILDKIVAPALSVALGLWLVLAFGKAWDTLRYWYRNRQTEKKYGR